MTHRFVILEHDYPTLHWDLLLENGDTCRTWRLLTEPTHWPLDAELIGNHRKHYLAYEGPVTGDRGVVSQWDGGTYVLIAQTETSWSIQLNGSRISGHFVLEKNSKGDDWRGLPSTDRG